MAEEVSEGRCGFTLEYEDLPVEIDDEPESTRKWYENTAAVCCWRESWDESDSGRCVWHADIDEKPVEELVASVCESDQRLDGAVLRGVNAGDRLSFHRIRLTGADLDGADLEGADFLGAVLVRANLWSVNLSGANLRVANLSDSDLLKADLSGAALRSADFSGVDLRGGDLSDASFVIGDLSGAVLPGVNLSGANLRDADLSSASFRNADFSGASLNGADLSDATLKDTDLTDATLEGANLTKAALERANLTRVNLFGADLRAANLYGAILTDVQLDANTRFGNHYTDEDNQFDPDESAWMFRQLQKLSRENALPSQARKAYLAHKDIRRKEQWAKAPIPKVVRKAVWKTKVSYWNTKKEVKRFIYKLFDLNEQEDKKQGSTIEATGVLSFDSDEPENGKHVNAVETINEPEDKAKSPDPPWLDDPTTLPADSRPASLLALLRWAKAATSGVVMRYGESPWRVIGISVLVMFVSAAVYPFVGGFDPQPESLIELVYMSVVTFTTLGYGDFAPATEGAQILASIQSFVGALLMALLVFVLGRRSTW